MTSKTRKQIVQELEETMLQLKQLNAQMWDIDILQRVTHPDFNRYHMTKIEQDAMLRAIFEGRLVDTGAAYALTEAGRDFLNASLPKQDEIGYAERQPK